MNHPASGRQTAKETSANKNDHSQKGRNKLNTEIRKRLAEWKQIKSCKPTPINPTQTSGKFAERWLQNHIECHPAFKKAIFFPNRRLYSQTIGHCREIDLIICSRETITLLEIKNWSGYLEESNAGWLQTKRNQDRIQHRSVIVSNSEKLRAAIDYLASKGFKKKQTFFDQHFQTKIIFTNKNLSLSEHIQKHPEIITRNNLDDYLFNYHSMKSHKGTLKRLTNALLMMLPLPKSPNKFQQKINRKDFSIITKLFASAKSWDVLTLDNGETIDGDLIEIQLETKILTKKTSSLSANGKPIRIKWCKPNFFGFIKALTGIGNLSAILINRERHEIHPGNRIIFHQAGQPKPTAVDALHVRELLLSE